MPGRHTNRREFLKTSSLAALAGASLPYWSTGTGSAALGFYDASERPVVGCIGVGDRWRGGVPQGVVEVGDHAPGCAGHTLQRLWGPRATDVEKGKTTGPPAHTDQAT